MQRYFSKAKENNNFILEASDYYHIIKVMRMKNGDNIEVVYDNKVYLCQIEIVNNNVNVMINKCLDKPEDKEPYVTLVIPLLKEQKLDIIFQKATELGVNELILTNFERSIIKLDSKKLETKLLRWEKILKEASEQSMRNNIPKLSFLEKNDLSSLDGIKVICSTNEKKTNFQNILKKVTSYDKLIIAIGPEGGFSSLEEEKMLNMGFIKTTLGNQILRVETVPMFVLSSIRYEFME